MSYPYRFILGIPEQGFHASRLFGFALNDTLGTIALAILSSYIFKISLVKSLIIWFVAGEILHYLFGVQTAFLTAIGIKMDSC
jgi:hypothetical protein